MNNDFRLFCSDQAYRMAGQTVSPPRSKETDDGFPRFSTFI
jgi:hypothetical protein